VQPSTCVVGRMEPLLVVSTFSWIVQEAHFYSSPMQVGRAHCAQLGMRDRAECVPAT